MAEHTPKGGKYLMAFALRDDAVTVARITRGCDEDAAYLHTMSPADARNLAQDLERAAVVAERKGDTPSPCVAETVPAPCRVEARALHLAPECADLLTEACAEIEQMTRTIGTMPADPSGNDLVLRGLAVRLHSLNSVIYWALLRDGTFDAAEAFETVHGPAQWRGAV